MSLIYDLVNKFNLSVFQIYNGSDKKVVNRASYRMSKAISNQSSSDNLQTTSDKKSSQCFLQRKFKAYNDDILSTSDIIKSIQNEKVGIICGNAGSGKTKILEMIHLKIQENTEAMKISSFFINLSECLEKFKRKDLNFNQKFSLAFLLTQYENNCIKEKSNEHKIIILFDGFDEVAPYYKDELISLFNSIRKNTNYSLWISIRPYHATELGYELNAKTFDIFPLESDVIENYLSEILTPLDYDKSKLLNIFDNFFKQQSEMNQPIVLKMIEEILLDKHANECLTENANLMHVVIKRKIEFGVLSKAALIPILKLALQTIFGDKFLDYGTNCESVSRNELLKSNLITYTSYDKNEYEFIYRSFAESIIAEYVIKNLWTYGKFFPKSNGDEELLSFLLKEIFHRENNEKYLNIYENVRTIIKTKKVKWRVDLCGENGIRREAIKTVELSEFKNIYTQQIDRKIQIIKVTKLLSIQDALDLLKNENFHKFLLLNSNIFVLIFEHYESSNIDGENIINYLPNMALPQLILSFECTCDKSHNIYYCNNNNGKYQRVRTTHITDDKFMHTIRDFFDINLLLSALRYKIIGSFYGRFDQIKVKTQSFFHQMRLIDHALENRNQLCIKFLQLFDLYDLNMENLKAQTILDIASVHCSENEFKMIQNCDEIFLHNYRDRKGRNLLMIAAKAGNIEAIEYLLKLNFDIHLRVNNKTAADFAYNKCHYDILTLLLNSNSKFPSQFNINFLLDDKKSVKLKKFIEIGEEMHKSVLNEDKNSISTLCQNYSHLRYFYNLSNESAAMCAVKNRKIKIYEFLLTNQLLLAPHESLPNNFNDNLSKDLLAKHYASKNQIFDDFIQILLPKCFILHSVSQSERDLYMKHIANAFIELSASPEVRPILQYLSSVKNFEIIFDFHRPCVNYLDPSTNDNFTVGITYIQQRRILIAAQDIFDEKSKYHVLGALAHELTHLAINLLFNNNFNPYHNDDIKTKLKFFAITKNCCDNCEKEICMKSLFQTYESESWHKELIVQVPHMIILYHENKAKLNYVKTIYKELFEFYEDFILSKVYEKLAKK